MTPLPRNLHLLSDLPKRYRLYPPLHPVGKGLLRSLSHAFIFQKINVYMQHNIQILNMQFYEY